MLEICMLEEFSLGVVPATVCTVCFSAINQFLSVIGRRHTRDPKLHAQQRGQFKGRRTTELRSKFSPSFTQSIRATALSDE